MSHVENRTRVVLIQHALELTERSNTGRHLEALLSHFSARVFGDRHRSLQADDLSGAWLLWPGAGPIADGAGPPSCLVVLDGSWSQARHMMQRVPQLRSLTRLSLVAPPGRLSLRAAPENGLSTLEAVAAALAELEGDAVAKPLRERHQALLQQQLADRGYVGPYR